MDNRIIAFIVVLIFWLGCTSEVDYSPKPRSFPKLEFPEKTYQKFAEDYCPFTFDYPTYARIEKDTDYFDQKSKNECWFDIDIPQYNGKIHCSYYPIDTDTSFEKMMSDAFQLASEHNVKAESIDEYPLQKPNGVSGFVFDIDGPTASPFQFFLTDSTNHFMRGSMYIKAHSNPDSLRPIVEFMKIDALEMLNSFEWK
jgi:gliding motility-associated lipoprotein GldD